MDTKASIPADTSTTDNLIQSTHDAGFGLFSLPSLRSLTLWNLDLDESFYTGVADAASFSQVGDGTCMADRDMGKALHITFSIAYNINILTCRIWIKAKV